MYVNVCIDNTLHITLTFRRPIYPRTHVMRLALYGCLHRNTGNMLVRGVYTFPAELSRLKAEKCCVRIHTLGNFVRSLCNLARVKIPLDY